MEGRSFVYEIWIDAGLHAPSMGKRQPKLTHLFAGCSNEKRVFQHSQQQAVSPRYRPFSVCFHGNEARRNPGAGFVLTGKTPVVRRHTPALTQTLRVGTQGNPVRNRFLDTRFNEPRRDAIYETLTCTLKTLDGTEAAILLRANRSPAAIWTGSPGTWQRSRWRRQRGGITFVDLSIVPLEEKNISFLKLGIYVSPLSIECDMFVEYYLGEMKFGD